MLKQANSPHLVSIGIMRQFICQTLPNKCSKFNYIIFRRVSNLKFEYRDVSSFNGIGFRLLYSPKSKILSIHHFSLNPFTLNESKKLLSEINFHTEQQVNNPDTLAYNELPTMNGVFLMRNKRVGAESRAFDNIEITNHIQFRVRH
jgi:hypothetical protein